MLALRCFACFQALMKNCRPKTSTTGVLRAHITTLAQGSCIMNMPITTSGMLRAMEAHRRFFSEAMRSRAIASMSAEASRSSPMMRS